MHNDLCGPVEGSERGVVELLLCPRGRSVRGPQLHGVRGDLELVDAPAQRSSDADAQQDDGDGVVRAENAPPGEYLE